MPAHAQTSTDAIVAAGRQLLEARGLEALTMRDVAERVDAYRQILKVPGVLRIEGTIDIYVDNQRQPQDQDIQLQPFELVYSTNHTLTVGYSS